MVDPKKNEEKLTEIVWCDHLTVTPRPLVLSEVPHILLHGGQPAYIVVEEMKIKLLCSPCWLRALKLRVS